MVYIVTGFFGTFPMIHKIFTIGPYELIQMDSGWALLTALSNFTGGIMYAARLPERLFPGMFDIWVISFF